VRQLSDAGDDDQIEEEFDPGSVPLRGLLIFFYHPRSMP